MKYFIVLDTEFISLRKGGQPFQIAMSAFKLSETNLIKISDFNVYITLRKGYYLNHYVKEYTGVTEEKLQDEGIYPDMATNQLLDYLLNFNPKETVLVGWDPINDIKMLNRLLNHDEEWLDISKLQWFDLAKSYSRLNNIPSGQTKSLTYAVETYGITNENAHDAVADCKVTYELFKKMIEIHGLSEVVKDFVKERKPKYKKVRA